MTSFFAILLLAIPIQALAFEVPARTRTPHVGTSPSRAAQSALFSATIAYGKAGESIATSSSSAPKSSSTRPLYQNWWPVSLNTALALDRPNAIELLGQKFVLFHDGEQWKCLADRCSHRFAPLSEGRIVREADPNNGIDAQSVGGRASCSIQCAYHGWQFSTDGKCTRVPQQSPASPIDERKAASVPSYPVREEAGMVWVWSDPDALTWPLADSVPLPISPMVRNSYDSFGAEACFMRDLPYGMELLGENLLDLSHLPFSHHSVGGLERDMGGELPLRVMSEQERVDYASWEKEFPKEESGATDFAVPLHQVEIVNASLTDPMFLVISKRLPGGVLEDANATISFFDPCHVRYRRERVPGTFGHVELFMSPTAQGKSRVFLWNVIHRPLPTADIKPTLKSRLAKLSPLALLKKVILAKLMNPATSRAHSMAHSIFDGDGIFLHKQGDRMRRAGYTFRDYSTPSSADVLLNAYRRYLDAAAKQAADNGGLLGIGSSAAEAVSYQNAGAYSDGAPRSQLLDRYSSHTKHCRLCSAEMESCEKKRNMCETVRTALVGATGASFVALVGALASASRASTSAIVPPAMIATSFVTSALGAIALKQMEKKLNAKVQAFKFEDYVHAEKN